MGWGREPHRSKKLLEFWMLGCWAIYGVPTPHAGVPTLHCVPILVVQVVVVAGFPIVPGVMLAAETPLPMVLGLGRPQGCKCTCRKSRCMSRHVPLFFQHIN